MAGPGCERRHPQAIQVADAVHADPGPLLGVDVLGREAGGGVEERDKPAITFGVECFSQEYRQSARVIPSSFSGLAPLSRP